MADETDLDKLISFALANGLDGAIINDQFPQPCQLLVSLNDDPKVLADYDVAAELSHEDSGYGPLIWQIGIETLKAARAAQTQRDLTICS